MGIILDAAQIRELLHIRYPMLMLDRVEIESPTQLTGIRNLTMNELFFQGHFPGHPILPGVMQVEAMRQLAMLAVAKELDPSGSRNVYMRKLESVKFRKPNLPGDRMKVSAEVESIENGEAVIKCKTANCQGVTCEAKITLAVREKSRPETMPCDYNEFDRNADIALDTVGLLAFMPHRYPFLLTDYIAKRDGDQVTSVKNVTGGEELFQAYEDDCKIFPESLLCEVMAQAGCACVLSRPENAGKIGYFMSIDSAEFFAPVYPGDQMVSHIGLPPSKSRFGKGSGEITVNGKLVMKITLMFAIVDGAK